MPRGTKIVFISAPGRDNAVKSRPVLRNTRRKYAPVVLLEISRAFNIQRYKQRS